MEYMKYLFGLILSAAGVLAADVVVVERIIAKINGDIITRSEIDRSRKSFADELRARGFSGERLDNAMQDREKDFFRDRIDQLLLVQKGKELNINVDTQVSKWLADIQLQNKISDPDKFQAWIKEQTGQSYEDFRAETKNGFLTQAVIRQEVGSRIVIPRSEIEKYYNEHKKEFLREERVFLREILVSTEGKDAAGIAAAEKKAKDLVARARKGERFPEMARDNSDAESAQQGGEIPPYKKGEMRKDIEELVWTKERNFVTDPIKLSNGFLILKVEEHHAAGQAQLEEVDNEIMERLYTPRMQPAVREYLTKLRQDAFLEIRDGFVDSGAASGKNTSWTDPAQLKPETISKAEVVSQIHRKRLLWLVPVPGTKTEAKSSSR